MKLELNISLDTRSLKSNLKVIIYCVKINLIKYFHFRIQSASFHIFPSLIERTHH